MRNPIRVSVQVIPRMGSIYNLAEDIYHRFAGKRFFQGFERRPEEVTDEEFLRLPAEEQQRVFQRAMATSSVAARRYMPLAMRQAEVLQQIAAAEEAVRWLRERHEERWLRELPASELEARAIRAGREDRAEQFKKLWKLAEKKREEEQQELMRRNEEMADREFARQNRLLEEYETAKTRIAEIRGESKFAAMEPRERVRYDGDALLALISDIAPPAHGVVRAKDRISSRFVAGGLGQFAQPP